jgi:hypothetical protein
MAYGGRIKMTEEDKAFTEIERRAKQRMESVRVAIATNPYRDQVIEEVAQHVEKLKGFSQELVCNLAIYIRGMKK